MQKWRYGLNKTHGQRHADRKWFILIYEFIFMFHLGRDNRSFNISGANINLQNSFVIFLGKLIIRILATAIFINERITLGVSGV